MREIKFRAWDKENEVMADVDFFSKSVIGIKNAEFEDIENFILLQFTGLHDKNGKEIYEGDVVQSVLGERTFTDQVVYKDAEFYAQSISDEEWLDELLSDCKGLEVIGNIYEHSHLLKEEVK